MIESLLQGALKLSTDVHLEPYQRGSNLTDGFTVGSTKSFRLVNDAGETTAVIDGWCFDGACYGYVQFDAAGEVVVSREVFSLTPGREHQPVHPNERIPHMGV
ncbi:hypothetical protein [Marinobacter zhejiangensis]|uniref:Uncharacterized protein n=1 Tax=Marinobacter zhejiangensis TaxID=488535 RepID=A0A1I4KX91_9GAMM|nr:hypothetical protein [Marinobacter zhejiangensis]SFL83037.1 hypothetical protein SAMN04487963_0122 [Marinobacter zhejiangensis]